MTLLSKTIYIIYKSTYTRHIVKLKSAMQHNTYTTVIYIYTYIHMYVYICITHRQKII